MDNSINESTPPATEDTTPKLPVLKDKGFGDHLVLDVISHTLFESTNAEFTAYVRTITDAAEAWSKSSLRNRIGASTFRTDPKHLSHFLTRTKEEEDKITDTEYEELERLLGELHATGTAISDRLDRAHQDVQSMLKISQLVRAAKEEK